VFPCVFRGSGVSVAVERDINERYQSIYLLSCT
jgi:hypothetical protein